MARTKSTSVKKVDVIKVINDKQESKVNESLVLKLKGDDKNTSKLSLEDRRKIDNVDFSDECFSELKDEKKIHQSGVRESVVKEEEVEEELSVNEENEYAEVDGMDFEDADLKDFLREYSEEEAEED